MAVRFLSVLICLHCMSTRSQGKKKKKRQSREVLWNVLYSAIHLWSLYNYITVKEPKTQVQLPFSQEIYLLFNSCSFHKLPESFLGIMKGSIYVDRVGVRVWSHLPSSLQESCLAASAWSLLYANINTYKIRVHNLSQRYLYLPCILFRRSLKFIRL